MTRPSKKYQTSTESLAAQRASRGPRRVLLHAYPRLAELGTGAEALIVAAVVNRGQRRRGDSWPTQGLSVQIEHATGLPHCPGHRDRPGRRHRAAPEGSPHHPGGGNPTRTTLTTRRCESNGSPAPNRWRPPQNATIDAMQQQPLVEGWTRQMDADPCQLCRLVVAGGSHLAEGADPLPSPTRDAIAKPKVVVDRDTIRVNRLHKEIEAK